MSRQGPPDRRLPSRDDPRPAGKDVFLEELITQHPPKHRTRTLARTHNVTTARVWIQSGRFHRQASPFVLNLHTVASGPIDRGEGRERQGGLGVRKEFWVLARHGYTAFISIPPPLDHA